MKFLGLAGWTLLMGLCCVSANAAPGNLKLCIGALNDAEASLKSASGRQAAPISPKFIAGKSGLIMMNSDPTLVNLVKNYRGSIRDIYECTKFGISGRSINVFLMAYHGYLPPDHFDRLSQCLAYVEHVEATLKDSIGESKAKGVGAALGAQVGEAHSDLRYMYPAKQQSLASVLEKVHLHKTAAGSLPSDEQPMAYAQLRASCDMFGIDSGPLVDVVGGRYDPLSLQRR